jgi:hypothetical protein
MMGSGDGTLVRLWTPREKATGVPSSAHPEKPAQTLDFCMINHPAVPLRNGAARTVLVHHCAHLQVFLQDICSIATICFQSGNE